MSADQFGFERFDFDALDRQERSTKKSRTAILLAIVLLLAGLLGFLFRSGPKFLDDLAKDVAKQKQQGEFQRAMFDVQRKMDKKDFRGAIESLNRLEPAFKSFNDKKGFLSLRADLYSLADQPEKAIVDYDVVLSDDPANHLALNNRAYMRALARVDIDEAIADVEKAIENSGPTAAYVDTRAYLYYLVGRYQEALQDLNFVLDELRIKRPDRLNDWGEIYFHRALVYRKLNMPEKAAADFESAKKHGYEKTQIPEPIREPKNAKSPSAPNLKPVIGAGKAKSV